MVKPLLGAQTLKGRHSTYWDGTTADGKKVAAGVYFVRLHAVCEHLTRKVVLARE